MAQAPATPKLRRRLIAARAALGLPPPTGLQASEQSALTLRAALRGHDMPTPEGVTLLIPLVGRHHVGDWGAVQARLRGTLDSLLAQSDPRWRAVICCQDRPDLPDDPRVSYLPFDDPAPGNDKWRKLAALGRHLPDMPPLPGYVMSFDADDLLHRDATRWMLRGAAPGGWLVEQGYVLNHATGGIGLAGRPTPTLPLRKPFWKLCGSCAALRYDPDLPQMAETLTAMTQHEHRMFPYLAALAGLRLTPLPRPAVLYVLNHGENFGARRGRVSFKARFVERFRITDPALLEDVAQGFPPVEKATAAATNPAISSNSSN